MSQPTKPTVALSDQRVEELWNQTARRLRKGRTARRARLALAAAAVLLVGGWAGLSMRASNPMLLHEGEEVSGPRLVGLADESHIALDPAARLRVDVVRADEVRVALAGGRAHFTVSKDARRSFHVSTRGVDVRVVGTRFSVSDLGDGIFVSVEEGVVEVTSAHESRRLSAGQTWHVDTRPEARSGPFEEPADATVDTEPVVEAPARERTRRVRVHAKLPAPTKNSLAPPVLTADELFSAGLEARRMGHSAQAIAVWRTFLTRFPQDERAGLASFEVGRIEMDVDHDVAAALSAIQQALMLAPEAAFAEDALARLAQLHASRGDRVECQKSKARYLSRYPRGAYAASLASLCLP